MECLTSQIKTILKQYVSNLQQIDVDGTDGLDVGTGEVSIADEKQTDHDTGDHRNGTS